MSRSTRYSSNSARATYDREVARVVGRNGLFIQMVSGSVYARRPTFAYTVGLCAVGHPELLTFGCCPDCAAALLTDVAGHVLDGEDVRPAALFDTERAGSVYVETVPNPEQIALAAVRFAARYSLGPVGLLQLTFPDDAGRFPSDEAFEPMGWRDPRPGEFSALT